MKSLNDLIYLLALIAISPKILFRIIMQNRYRQGWSERFGKISRKFPDKKCIWIHAVSVGEVNATKTVIDELKKNLPDYEIVLSATTDTGIEGARKLYGSELKVFYFPLDFSPFVHRAFKNLKPDICLLMELEIWPNFIIRANQLGIPVVVINGRISDRSFPKYNLVKFIVKPVFQKVSLFLAQSEEYAERFILLGGRRKATFITGSLKYDTTQIAETVEGAQQLAGQLNLEGKRVFVAGGTGPKEEEIILSVFKKLKKQDSLSDLKLVIVPRKPERFDKVAKFIKKSGFKLVRYSRIKSGKSETALNDKAVILGDTMGDLRKFYSLATIVFVGRSLVPMGGSDMMESAAMGKCTIFGPHIFNFKQPAAALLNAQGAIEVSGEKELYQAIQKCLNEPQFAQKIARNGQQVIRNNQGATKKTINAIVGLLQNR